MNVVRAEKIGRNDACPCGSGKKYKKCCAIRDELQPLLGMNYLGEEVRVNKENLDILSEKINLLPFKKLLGNENITIKETENAKHSDFKLISMSEGVEALQELYGLYDSSYDEVSSKVSCSRGCTSCCNLYVDVSPIEAENIRRFVVDSFSEDEQLKLHKKIKENMRNSPSFEAVIKDESIKGNYLYKQSPCAFLDNKGACTIYDARPFNCRKHGVISDPIHCKDPNSLLPKRVSIQTNGALDLAVMKINVGVFGEYFMRKNGLESVFFYKHISHWFALDNFEQIS